jgi:hypothetical protein
MFSYENIDEKKRKENSALSFSLPCKFPGNGAKNLTDRQKSVVEAPV